MQINRGRVTQDARIVPVVAHITEPGRPATLERPRNHEERGEPRVSFPGDFDTAHSRG